MIRRLTLEERELWEKLRRSVRPLRPKPAPTMSGRQTADLEAAPLGAAAGEPSKTVAARPPVNPTGPPLVRLEERTRRRLARGLTEIDGRIDLHGMRQERAY